MRIVVPEGGARGIEIGIHGTSDLAMLVMEDPFTFGGIRPGTAQAAPLVPVLTPLPRAVEPVPAPGAAPASAPADPGLVPLFVALAIGGAGVVLLGVAIPRRRRAASRSSSSSSSSAAPTA
jgi:hypothetical protein